MDLQAHASGSAAARRRVIAAHHQQSPYPAFSPAVVVPTGVDTAGEQQLVLGLDVVVADLAPYSTLAYAHTFGEARTDATAAGLLADHLDDYLESVIGPDETWDDMDALYYSHTADRLPFDADEFFGGEWNLGGRSCACTAPAGCGCICPNCSRSCTMRTPPGASTMTQHRSLRWQTAGSSKPH